MEKLPVFTTKASATTNLCKVLKKVMGKDSAASPDANKKAGGRKARLVCTLLRSCDVCCCLIMCSIAAMDSDGEDEAEYTCRSRKQKKKIAGGGRVTQLTERGCIDCYGRLWATRPMVLIETCRLKGEANISS